MLIQEEVKEIYVWEDVQPITQSGIYWSADLGLISLSSNGTDWITIADKNLGATKVYNDGDTLSEANCGKYYQRGNNYGFPFSGATTTSSTTVNASAYGPNNYYSSSTFITTTTNGWDNSNNANLWGGTNGTYIAMQGPCAAGYHIPKNNERTSLLSILTNWGLISSTDGAKTKQYLKLPFAGNLYYNGGRVGDGVGSYWSCINTNATYALFCSVSNSTASGSNNNYKTFGYSIRPFKNEAVQPREGWTKLF